MEKTLCEACQDREHCQTACKPVNDILWKDNHVFERHSQDAIVVFPPKHETHFSGFADYQLDEISNEDAFPWSSGDYKLTQTNVFIEKFFNKTSTKELAERFGIKEQAVLGIYWDAQKKLEKLIKVLDIRACGLKALKPERFTPDQKMFLLVYVFRFNAAEVAEMFHHDASRVSGKLRRMADKYADAFSGLEKSVDDRPMAAEKI